MSTSLHLFARLWYEIKKSFTASYELNLPPLWKAKYPVFHEEKLVPYFPPLFPSQRKPPVPLPKLINEEEEYKIDHILDSRVSNNTLQYLVKWKEYSFEDSTWENVTNLDNSQTAIKAFHKHFPNAYRSLFCYLPKHDQTTSSRELFLV